jgi:ELWxxDGT repeat protein
MPMPMPMRPETAMPVPDCDPVASDAGACPPPRARGRRRLLAGLVAAMCAATPVLAQPVSMADINQGNGPVASGYPDQFIALPNTTIFFACSDEFGCELWGSYNDNAEAQPFTDICPGPCSSNPRELAVAGPGVLFSADDGQHGRELWLFKANLGQPAQMMPQRGNGVYDSDPRYPAVVNASGDYAAWVWVRGSTGGWRISRLNDLYEAPQWDLGFGPFDTIGPLVEQGGRLFFAGSRTGSNQGYELWRIDDPAGSASLAFVRDIRPGSEGSSIVDMVAVPQRGGVFFRADDGSSGPEPWFSDGTAAGTRRLGDLAPGSAGSRPDEPTAFANGSVFFFADDLGTGNNRDLWAVDGAGLTPRKVRNFGNGLAQGLRPLGGGMVFIAADAGAGTEFWASGGLTQSTFQITDLIPGSGGLGFDEAVVSGNFYYLSTGDALYRTDISAAGTRRVGLAAGDNDIRSLFGGEERVLFGNIQGAGDELYHSRLNTPEQISLIGNLAADLGHSQGVDAWAGRPGYFELDGGIVGFFFDEDEGLELRRLDGAGGATVLTPTQAGPGSLLDEGRLQAPSTAVRDGRLYFADTQRGLWVSDGTATGTRRLDQFLQASAIACVLPRGNGDVLVVLERSGQSSLELWRVDGAGGPSQALLTPAQMPAGASLGTHPIGCPVELGGQLLLRAFLPASGFELFRSNLSPGHLALVRDLAPGSADGMASRVEPVLAGGKLYFSGDRSGTGDDSEPWVSDGTAQGTFQLADTGFEGVPGPHSFTVYGNDVVFAADGKNLRGHQVWRSNGTTAGTRALTTPSMPVSTVLPLTEAGPAGRGIAVDGARIFFLATPGSGTGTGSRLYVSAGQPGDLRLLAPAGATEPLVPQQLRTVPGAGVVFSAVQGTRGRELWFSDGSSAGTLLAAEVNAVGHGGPLGISVLSDGVYFTADDGVRGREPWRLPIPSAEAIFASGFEQP